MLYSESAVKCINGLDILSEANYLFDDISTPKTIPVVENSDLGAAVVRFSDIESISESYGCDYIDAMEAVAEQNDIAPEYLAVAVDEARIIEEPELINELANVVINPQSENSLAYQFCEAMVDSYAETGDEAYLEAMTTDQYMNGVNQTFDNYELHKDEIMKSASKYKNSEQAKHDIDKLGRLAEIGKRNIKANSTRINPTVAKAAYNTLDRLKKEADNAPRTWLAHKVASLRGLYYKWLERARTERDLRKAGIFKTIASKVMGVIDYLMSKLQGLTNKIGNNDYRYTFQSSLKEKKK